jgi:hypothetical protein
MKIAPNCLGGIFEKLGCEIWLVCKGHGQKQRSPRSYLSFQAKDIPLYRQVVKGKLVQRIFWDEIQWIILLIPTTRGKMMLLALEL